MSQASCVWREACAFLNSSQYKLQFLIPFFSFFIFFSLGDHQVWQLSKWKRITGSSGRERISTFR
jgi:hypothetical protein